MSVKKFSTQAPQTIPATVVKPSLGTTAHDILNAFKQADGENCGRCITEALIVGGGMRFRWQGSGKLGVVVGEICIRDATKAELAELDESIELGQVDIYTTPMYHATRVMTRTAVLHQATGSPLDPNSDAARRQRSRWAQAELVRKQASQSEGQAA